MLNKVKNILASTGRAPSVYSSSVPSNKKKRFRWLLIAVLIYILFCLFLAIWWSGEPRTFSINDITLEKIQKINAKGNSKVKVQNTPNRVVGAATTATLIHVAETLLNKKGGYTSNDIFPPGAFIDNMPNWEFGALTQIRDLAKAMREAYSRSQSQSAEDSYLAEAEPLFNFNNDSWLLPASEDEYRNAIAKLEEYLAGLLSAEKQNAQFYSRADNLRYWLRTVESRLGSVSQNLSASVGQKRLNTDLAGDASAQQSTQTQKDQMIKTPWNEIDDNFYYARGMTWALIHFLKAAEIDFSEVLDKKNAKVSVRQIIRELEATQEKIYSPIILNGSGFGVLTNHSLVMASYVARANAAIIDLRELLEKG